MKQKTSGEGLRCSFCHKNENVVGKLIATPSDYPRAYICDECIVVCHSILEDERVDKEEQDGGSQNPEPIERSGVFVPHLIELAKFSAEKMSKVDVFRGEMMFAGLNCFVPRQEHAPHAHAGQDKLYVVLAGEAEAQIGGEKSFVAPGAAAFAPSGVVHSIRNVGEARLIVMAVLAPPPK